MMRARIGWVLIGWAVLASVQADARSRHPDPNAVQPKPTRPEKNFPLGAIWVLQTIGGKPVSGDAPSFSIDEQLRATGFGGCNSFSLTMYPMRDQKLAAGAVAMTHKACAPPVMALEHSFLVGLHSMPKWDVSPEGTLTVTGATGTMTFRRGV
jgi:heat shock protein HslJ